MDNIERALLTAAAENGTLRVQYGNQGFSLFNEDGCPDVSPDRGGRVYVRCDYTKRTDEIQAIEGKAREYVSCG